MSVTDLTATSATVILSGSWDKVEYKKSTDSFYTPTSLYFFDNGRGTFLYNLSPNTLYYTRFSRQTGTINGVPQYTYGGVSFTTLPAQVSSSFNTSDLSSITLDVFLNPFSSNVPYTVMNIDTSQNVASGTTSGGTITISGLAEGTQYNLRVSATGYVSENTITASTKSRLTATATSINPTSVSYAITRIGTIALPASAAGYTVTDSSGNTYANTSLSGSTLTITGLTMLQTYSFTIAATGFVSATPAAVTTVRPLTATLVAGSITTTTAQFDMSGGDPMPMSYTASSGASTFSVSASDNRITVSGLLPGTVYSSLGITSAGYQVARPSSFTTVKAFSVSDVPVSRGANYVTLQLTPLGGTVLPTSAASYVVQDVSASRVTYNSSSRQLTISGLTEFTTYTFVITPTSIPAQTVTVRTADITAPGSITGLAASSDDQTVTISWNLLSDNGTLISYKVRDLCSNVVTDVSSNSVILTGLANGTTYTYEVKAVDADGNNGAPSTTVGLTPSRVPYQPPVPVVTPGQNSAVVAWDTVANGGAAITQYTVRAYLATNKSVAVKTVTGAASPITVDLSANQVYVFTVSATNLRGESAASTFSTPKYISDKVICFLADAPVRIPGGGVRAIANIQEGDLVETADGRAVAVQRVSVMACQPGAGTNPYVIPCGKWGATEDLRISPNHKIAVGNGRMVEAKNLGLKQDKMTGTITYYNLELPNWSTDRLVVAGVEVESLAPVRRKAIPLAAFNAMIARKYGPNPAPGVVDKIRRMCTFLPNGMVEYPFLKA